MASKFESYSATDDWLAYEPVVARDKPEGYSAAEVNRLLMDVEQTFGSHLRQLENQLAHSQGNLNTRHIELAKLANLAHKRADAAQASLGAKSGEVTSLKKELTARDQELEERNQEITALEEKLKGLGLDLDARDRDLVELKEKLEQQLATAQADRDATAENEARLTGNIKELEQAIDAMRQSLSWRITRPLRKIRSLMGRY